MRIVFIDPLNLSGEQIRRIKAMGDTTFYSSPPQTDQELIDRLSDNDIAVVNWVTLPDKIIDKVKGNLKYLIIPYVGYDWVDVGAAKNKGIRVLNSPNQSTDAVANFTIALLFALTRKIVVASLDIRNGFWRPQHFTGVELSSKTIGVIGYGRIGKRVADIARSLGMIVLWANSTTSIKDLEQIISSSDVVTLHVSYKKTAGYVLDAKRLRSMKKGSYIINTSRGSLINESVLLEQLRNGHLAGVALDVLTTEPLDYTSQMGVALKDKYNLIITPHMAFNTLETDIRRGEELILNIQSCIHNKPVNVVN